MNPTVKRIIWILIGALLIAAVLLGLWLWYLGQQQQTSSTSTTTGVNTSNVGVTQNQGSGGSGNPLAYGTSGVLTGLGSLFNTFTGFINHNNTGTGSSQNGTYTGGQYTYPVYSGSGGYPGGTGGSPPGTGGTGITGPGTTTTPVGGTCSFSCSCGNDGTQTCTDGTQNTDGSCHITTQTCAQGSACAECPNGGNPATTTPIGGVWIPGGGNPFNPTPINGVSSSSPTGSGNIFNPNPGTITGGGGNTGGGITSTLLDAGITAAACSLLVQEQATADSLGGAAGTAVGASATANAALGVHVSDVPLELAAGITATNAAQNTAQQNTVAGNQFLSCMARYLARTILNQITANTVNWINSGFHGSPTFVQDYQQIFADAANQAAGAYLQSSNFSFLCSPFALQVKIAVAQSYATSQAPPTSTNSCTLNQVTSNITNFLHGDFSAGGWPALISLTNAPLNNPFGAYIQLSSGLQGAISQADQKLSQSISPEGFLSIYQVNSCANQQQGTKSSNVGTVCPVGCHCTVTTPGTVIANQLSKTLGAPIDQLNAAQDFDQIISALMNQLIQTALQGGVSNLSGGGPSSTGGGTQPGADLAQQLLTQMQGDTNTAQQYGYIEQGSIQDIQNTQAQLQTLANCWGSAATSTAFSADKQAQAAANASSTEAQITSLQQQVDADNNQITIANSAIALLQQLQTQVLNANSASDVQTVQTTYTTDQSNGSLITVTDLTTAQQNRTTLQSQLATINQDTSTQLQQCYAFGT